MEQENQRACPKCGRETVLENRTIGDDDRKVEVDLCRSCRGVWLDRGEVSALRGLGELLPRRSSNIAWRRDLQKGACPACAERPELERVGVGSFGVDLCPQCGGLWFDGGELGPMLTDQGFKALLKALLSARSNRRVEF